MSVIKADSVRDPSNVDPLQIPEGVRSPNWVSAIFIISLHLFVVVGGVLALCGLVPSFFSGSALALMFALIVPIGWCGIGICYHRLLTHRSFECSRWFERLLTMLAFCNLEGSSLWWVSVHRRHHHHSDTQPDPHTPLVNFLWSHIGWLLFFNKAIEGEAVYQNTRDLQRDPFHVWMHRHNRWLLVWLLHAIVIFAVGFVIGFAQDGITKAYQTALGFVVWGVAVRTVFFWNSTWLVNSATHMWGYQNYKSKDESRNSWWVAIITGGEGWHNNHHYDQVSATVQHRWWEIDPSYYIICTFRLLGLVWNVKTPDRKIAKTSI